MLAFSTAARDQNFASPPPQADHWAAAGLTLMAADSKRLLALKRSFFWPDTKSGGVWCNAGGSRDREDKTPLCTALRETGEEILNFCPSMLIGEPVLSYIHRGRSGQNPNPFMNFIGVVRKEFDPVLDPKENDDARWLHAHDWPRPMHFGMEAFFNDPFSRRVLDAKRVCPRAVPVADIPLALRAA